MDVVKRESHNMEMSQNKECFKHRGVQNITVVLKMFLQETSFRNVWGLSLCKDLCGGD
jgi:hypothetical protein